MSTQHGLVCQTCHGSVLNVGESIDAGRKPWLEEPSCGAVSCHGSRYAEEPGQLYRNSRGHGGLFCSACHGSPHAIVPEPRGSRQRPEHFVAGTPGDIARVRGVSWLHPVRPGSTRTDRLPVRVDGDVNSSGAVTSSETSPLPVNYVFKGGASPEPCDANGNVNCDAQVTSSDIIHLVNFVFKGGPAPCDICTDSPLACL